RLEFKSQYGASKLDYPLFNDDGYDYPIKPTQSFDKLLLRAGSQDGLNAEFGSEREAQFVRNRFIFDVQMAMGYPAPHGRFVHLFVNGEYMGQYHFMERPDLAFFASYFGGSKAEYEVRKSGEYLNQPVDPLFYNQLETYAYGQDLSQEADYQGLADYLDTKQAADYLVFNHYLGNFDWSQNHNSWGGAKPYVGAGGYKFMMWDVDLTLDNVGGFQEFYGNLDGFDGTDRYGPVPEPVYNSAAFRLQMADQTACLCTDQGLLTPEVLDSMYMLRANQVSRSLIAESARWGQQSFSHFRHIGVSLWDVNDEWQKELDSLRTRFLAYRTDSLLKYYRARGIYPSLEPVSYSPTTAAISQSTPLTLSHSNASGSIYYTLDGSDPRSFSGAASPNALLYTGPITLPKGVRTIKARVLDGSQWSAMCPREYFVEPNYQGLVINEIQYHPDTLCIYPATCFDGILNGGETEIDCGGICPNCPLDLRVDTSIVFQTGNVFGVNGDFGTAQIQDGGQTLFITDNAWKAVALDLRMSESLMLEFDFRSDRQGEVHAIGLGNGNSYSGFFKLYGTQDWGNQDFENYPGDNSWQHYSIPIGTYFNGSYNRLVFIADHDNSPRDGTSYFRNVRVQGGEIDSSLSMNLRLEYLEFKNPTADTLDLGGAYFAKGLRYTFPAGAKIDPGELKVISRDTALFRQVYGFAAFDQYAGALDNSGESLVLVDPFGVIIDSVRYRDGEPWDQWADGQGPSLELIRPDLDNALAASWIAQPDSCGSPGQENQIDCALATPPIVINEVMAFYDEPPQALDAGDWLELYNSGSSTVDLSLWQLVCGDTILILPTGTALAAGSYLVLADSLSKFAFAHPAVGNVIELPGLRLNRGGENLSLRTASACLVKRAAYPPGENDDFSSHSLLAPGLDPLLPDSWYRSQNYGGTPGKANQKLCAQAAPSIIINEINYRSNPAFESGDWVELYNATDSTVDLSG
ncbi:MAG: lamin tail domain-containing protein, partial [Bacteroidota bacterium]